MYPAVIPALAHLQMQDTFSSCISIQLRFPVHTVVKGPVILRNLHRVLQALQHLFHGKMIHSARMDNAVVIDRKHPVFRQIFLQNKRIHRAGRRHNQLHTRPGADPFPCQRRDVPDAHKHVRPIRLLPADGTPALESAFFSVQHTVIFYDKILLFFQYFPQKDQLRRMAEPGAILLTYNMIRIAFDAVVVCIVALCPVLQFPSAGQPELFLLSRPQVHPDQTDILIRHALQQANHPFPLFLMMLQRRFLSGKINKLHTGSHQHQCKQQHGKPLIPVHLIHKLFRDFGRKKLYQ